MRRRGAFIDVEKYVEWNIDAEAEEAHIEADMERRRSLRQREPGRCVECSRLSDYPTCHACTDEFNREQAS